MRSLLGCALALTCLSSTAAGQSHLLVVSGLAGDPRIEEQFHNWSSGMITAAQEKFGLPAEHVTYLAENPARDPSLIGGEATKANIEAAIARIAQRAGPSDRVLLLLIGHGSSDGNSSRINLPGPDLTAEELATMLDRFPTQSLVVVNTASASGAFQEPLAGRNRTIITATNSGTEQNETVFARYFVQAFSGDGADTDKDGRVTVLEAYDYANSEVKRFYDSDNRLQTEHSVLAGDRELARAFAFGGAPRATAPTAAASTSPEIRGLLEQREELEGRVQALTGRKDQMEPAAYERELESLLLELARTNREIREKEGTQ